MISGLSRISIALGMMVIAQSTVAQCTDKEFSQFQIYGLYQEANPRIPDGQLRAIFGGALGMQRVEFKEFYLRCATRQRDMQPDEVRASMQREKEAFVADCAKQPANILLCKTVRVK